MSDFASLDGTGVAAGGDSASLDSAPPVVSIWTVSGVSSLTSSAAVAASDVELAAAAEA